MTLVSHLHAFDSLVALVLKTSVAAQALFLYPLHNFRTREFTRLHKGFRTSLYCMRYCFAAIFDKARIALKIVQCSGG